MAKHKNKTTVAEPAWRLLRLALLWAQKGGAFKPCVFLDLRLFLSHLKNPLHGKGGDGGRGRLHYHEQEFSFDDTPVFHFKTHRPGSLRLPRIPCITPSFFQDDDEIFLERLKLLKEDGTRQGEEGSGDNEEEESDSEVSGPVEVGEEGIDSRAERFIVEFYERMTAQRETSCLEYSEILRRGMSC